MRILQLTTAVLVAVLVTSSSAVDIRELHRLAANDIDVTDFSQIFDNPEPHLSLKPRITTAQRIAQHEYPVETHPVVTEDGYIITLFRIPYSHKLQNQNEKRPIVLFQHGLFSCSDGWIVNGPNDALVYMLADAGYDVWIGNARGNTYSRNHTTRSVNNPRFWRFSWHEIGHYDLAAMIDYALATNGQGQKAIHYVGHSQGTTAFFVLLSSRPEYNAKIKTAHMLAPVAFMNNMDDWLVCTLAPYLGHHNSYSAFFGSQEFVPYNDLIMTLAFNLCGSGSSFLGFCSVLVSDSPDSKTNITAMPYMAETHPAGASTDQICHYLQEQQSGFFRQFDFGSKKNMKVYGQDTPPDYPLPLISAEMHLWYSDNDDMAAVVDVERMAELLPNKVMHHMDDPTWNHGDFVGAMEARKYVNDPIVVIMQGHEEKNSS